MRLPLTLSLYVGRQFLMSILMVLGVMTVIVFIIDLVELIRRAASREGVSIGLMLELALLKLPSMVQRIVPFAVLIGSILTLSRLTRSSELVVVRSAGVSAWQFLTPAMIVTLGLGLFTVMAFNPLSAAMLTRFEQLEAVYLKGRASLLAVSSSGLWLRQIDDQPPGDLTSHETGERFETVVHALRVSQENMTLHDVIVFFYDNHDRFIQRIDAEKAYLKPGYWEINDAFITAPGSQAREAETYRMPTELTMNQIQDSFSSPETLSFWHLQHFIETLEKAGFSAMRHRLHFHAVLALPFLMSAMVLIGATFAMRPTRMGSTGMLISAGVITGFMVYFLSDIVHALGLSGSIPLLLAAWAPAGISLLAGMTLLLHFEDG